MLLDKRKRFWSLVFHGVLLVCVGLSSLIWNEEITNIVLDHILVVTPTSFILGEWVNTTAKMDVEVFFFNWTNPNDFKNKSIKPKFKEVGPYYFSEHYKKVDIVFNDNNTVSFRVNKTFIFDEKKSKLSLEDAITSLNVIPLLASDKARNWNYVLRKFLSIALNGVPYESQRKIKELLFEGYEDPLLTTANYLPFLDNIPKMEKFAWFFRRNASADYEGSFTMGTGQGNTTLGTIYKWNYKDRGSYPGHCGAITAPMDMFPQPKADKLEAFNSEFCRKVILDFNETLTYDGLEAYKYIAGDSFLDSGTINPENNCLCSKKCQNFGVVDYSHCKYGIPIFLSYPHFLKADPTFRKHLEGLKSDQKKYESYVILNSRTGVILNMKLSIQLNIFVEPNPLIRKYSDVPEIMFPVLWFSVILKVSDTILSKLKLLNLIPVVLRTVSAILIFLGVTILTMSIHRRLTENKRRAYSEYHKELPEELKPLGAKMNIERNETK